MSVDATKIDSSPSQWSTEPRIPRLTQHDALSPDLGWGLADPDASHQGSTMADEAAATSEDAPIDHAHLTPTNEADIDDEGFITHVHKKKKNKSRPAPNDSPQDESPLSKRPRDKSPSPSAMLTEEDPLSAALQDTPTTSTLPKTPESPYWCGVRDGQARKPGRLLTAAASTDDQVKYWKGVAQGLDTRDIFDPVMHNSSRGHPAHMPSTGEPTILVPETPDMSAGRTDLDEDMPDLAEFSDSSDEEMPGLILPPNNRFPNGRPAAHQAPQNGPLVVFPLPNIDRPDGPSRANFTSLYDGEQREALFNYDGHGAWIIPETRRTPVDPDYVAAVLEEFSGVVFAGQRPLRVTTAFEQPDGSRSNAVFVAGSEDQIEYLTKVCVWSTSKLCFFAFPNHDTFSTFVVTLDGLRKRMDGFRSVLNLVAASILASTRARIFAEIRGKVLGDLLTGLALEYIEVKDRHGFTRHLWNVSLPPPVDNEEDLIEWRGIIAALKPCDPVVGQLKAFKDPFQCGTCGSLRHPQGMCSTIEEDQWFGFIPSARMGPPPLPQLPAAHVPRLAYAGDQPQRTQPVAVPPQHQRQFPPGPPRFTGPSPPRGGGRGRRGRA